MNDQAPEREAPPERSPWSRPSVLLSGAFLLALVLLGVVVATTGGGSHSAPPRTPSAVQPAAPAPTANTAASGCTLPASDQSVPSSAPPPARWQPVGSMQVPQNPAMVGPQRSSG